MNNIEDINKAIDIIRHQCKSFRESGKDCNIDYCIFGANCPVGIGDVPPSDWVNVEELNEVQ